MKKYSFLEQVEYETNSLVVKVLWGLFVGGLSLLAALIAVDTIQTTWAEWLIMALILLLSFGSGSLLNSFAPESPYTRFF